MAASVDISRAIRKLGRMDRNVRFAAAVALTRTAQDMQAEVRRELRASFTLRNDFTSKAVVIQPATRDSLSAAVLVGTRTEAFRRIRDALRLQVTGGSKSPTQGRSIAVPLVGVRRNKRDIITRANRPRQLLGNGTVADQVEAGRAGGRGNRRPGRAQPFILEVNGRRMIVRRNKARGRKTEGDQFTILYLLEATTRQRARFDFEGAAIREARRRFGPQFERAMAQALATAR